VNTKLQWSNGRLNSATTLQNRRRTTNIFGVFSIFETKAEGNSKQSKIFLDFQIANRKLQVKQTKDRKPKKQKERNNGNIFGLFVFWKSGNKNENNKESEAWIYNGPTKYDM
jgi:hypothetical protein